MSFFERRVRPRYEDVTNDGSSSDEETNNALNVDWDEPRTGKARTQPSNSIPKRTASPKPSSSSQAASDSESDSDSAGAPQALSSTKPANFSSSLSKRSSKHAPQVLSTRKPVPRARTVISGIPTQKPRDPRFDPGLSHSLSRPSSGVTRQRYAFLDNYVADELTTLKKAAKDSRATLEDRERAKKAASAIENRRRQQEQREREEAVVRAHRQEQRQREQEQKSKRAGDDGEGQDTAPASRKFYLKKGEIKRRVLEDRFRSMTEKQAERAMERKRRRRAGKDRKLLPVRRA